MLLFFPNNFKFCAVKKNYIQDYFVYISKILEKCSNDSPIQTTISKIENRSTFEIKIGYYLELLKPEIMKLLGSTEKRKLKIKMVKKYLT